MKASLIACCLVALGGAACSGRADIPDTPDLSALLQSYERPTATLDVSGVTDALGTMPNLKQLAAGFKAADYVMSNDINQANSATSAKSGSRLRLQGSLDVKVRCPGERTDPNYDESVNGSVSFTLAVADNHIRRTFGGEAKACVLQGTVLGLAARIELDGDMAFDMGQDIGIGQYWSGELLASLPGELRVDDYVFQSISGRLTQGSFQNLVRLSDGTTAVLELSDTGVTVRDSQGVWFCAEGQPCAQQ